MFWNEAVVLTLSLWVKTEGKEETKNRHARERQKKRHVESAMLMSLVEQKCEISKTKHENNVIVCKDEHLTLETH